MQITTLSSLLCSLIILSCIETNENLTLPTILVSEKTVKVRNEVQFENTSAVGIDSIASGLIFHATQSYRSANADIKGICSKMSKTKAALSDSVYLDSIGIIFTEALLNKIVPHWYGTPWDFEGHTPVPNQGSVACGYFVSSTLNHMGINVNRYKLAQQGPKNEAISIALDSSKVSIISNTEIDTYLKQLKKGLYFIGLDNHVGYLVKRNNVSYFLHSNYVENKVMIEKVDESHAFWSTTYYLADITHNRELIWKWLLKSEVVVFKG